MKYNIYHKILIEGVDEEGQTRLLNLNTFNSLMINNDIESLTDTCTITIPYKNIAVTPSSMLVFNEKGGAIPVLEGDKITVYLTYVRNRDEDETEDKGTGPKVFYGYITKFDVDEDIITINCEDSMYLLKQNNINLSYPKNTNSIDLFNNIFSKIENTDFPLNFEKQIIDTNLGKIRTIGAVTPAELFQNLKDKYKFYTYFRNKYEGISETAIQQNVETKSTLHFGLKYNLTQEAIEAEAIPFAYPYRETSYPIIQNNLNYQYFNKNNQLIVVGNTIDDKNNKIRIATINGTGLITDKGVIDNLVKERGFRINIDIPNVDLNTLENSVYDTFNNYPESGFEGSFTTFGFPRVQQGDKVNLQIDDGFDNLIVEQYYVDRVVTKVNSTAGFIQEVFIGGKV